MVKLFSDSDNDEGDTPSISRADILDMCQRLACNMAIPSFLSIYHHNLRIFRINYGKKN
jgi:hypothetical protein